MPDQYLVTGGAGFIGSHIVARLLEDGQRVRVLDNFVTGKRANLIPFLPDIELQEGDLRELPAVMQACRGVDYVLHQAALGSVPRSVADPLTTHHANVTGTLHVLMAAREAGVRRVVYASSSSVYGNTPTLPKHEDIKPAPLSPYAVSKLAGEHYCQVFLHAYGLESVALRYFNVFGPRQDPESQYAAVIPRFITCLLQDRPATIYGDGTQSRDFTYVANVVQANLLAAAAPDAGGAVVNVACQQRHSLLDLHTELARLLGKHIAPVFEPPPARRCPGLPGGDRRGPAASRLQPDGRFPGGTGGDRPVVPGAAETAGLEPLMTAPLRTPVRILYLITDTETGGSEKVLLETIRHLDRTRFEPELLTLKPCGSMAPRFQEIPGLTVTSLGMGEVPDPITCYKLWRHIKQGRYAILHTFLYQADILGRVAGRVAGVPVIVSSLRALYRWLKPWHLRLDRWTSGLADQITAVSDAARQFAIHVEGIAADRIVTLRTGIDLQRFELADRPAARRRIRQEFSLADDVCVLSLVSRLHPDKGHDVLLAALAELIDLPVAWHALLVGEGPCRGEWEQLVQRHGLGARVTFTGLRRDIPEILAATDIFVFPSRYEGLPNAVIEAMAMALPVIASAADGTVEVVKDGVTGRLVPAGDAAALRQALAELLRQPQLHAQWGAAGRARVEAEFSLPVMMARLHELYASLLQEKHGP